MTGYTGFSSEPTEQQGNYLALKFDTVPADTTIVVDLLGGTKGPVTLDSDRMHILLIKNKDTQSVKVTISKDGASVDRTYTLTGLNLETE